MELTGTAHKGEFRCFSSALLALQLVFVYHGHEVVGRLKITKLLKTLHQNSIIIKHKLGTLIGQLGAELGFKLR